MNMHRIGQLIAQKASATPMLAGIVTIAGRRYNLQLRANRTPPGQAASYDVWAVEDATAQAGKAATAQAGKAAALAVGYKALSQANLKQAREIMTRFETPRPITAIKADAPPRPDFLQAVKQASVAVATLTNRKISNRAERNAQIAELYAAKDLIDALQRDVDAAINASRAAAFVNR